MTSYTRREVTVTRIEFVIEAPSNETRYWQGLRQAVAAITAELGPEAASYDDAVRIEARDDEIILSYEVG